MAVRSQTRLQRHPALAYIAVLLAGLCCWASACELGADPSSDRYELSIGGMDFPPIDQPLEKTSQEFRALGKAFEGFMVDASLPALSKDDFLEIPSADIAVRKMEWIDANLVRRFARLRPDLDELERLARAVPVSRSMERLAASALVGCAQRMYSSDWKILTDNSGLWMLGIRASVPAGLSQEQIQELEAKESETLEQVRAYFEERVSTMPSPRPDLGLDHLRSCMRVARQTGSETLRAWHEFCAEWAR